jgi:mRNA-degrading endonuclease RelE of RelBE toxin-antitoxin system
MIFRRTERFLKAFRSLPADIQKKTMKALTLFAENQRHPSLHVKKMVGYDDIWEVRVDLKYRFTAHYEKNENGDVICVLRNVDNHDECLKNP